MKALIESKTFWVAVAQAVVAVLIVFMGAFPDANWVGAGLLLKSLLDMYLRSLVVKPVVSILP